MGRIHALSIASQATMLGFLLIGCQKRGQKCFIAATQKRSFEVASETYVRKIAGESRFSSAGFTSAGFQYSAQYTWKATHRSQKQIRHPAMHTHPF
jgi:hypothetical protein